MADLVPNSEYAATIMSNLAIISYTAILTASSYCRLFSRSLLSASARHAFLTAIEPPSLPAPPAWRTATLSDGGKKRAAG